MKKVRRNDPCPCGSGRKYKNCCQRKSRPAAAPNPPVPQPPSPPPDPRREAVNALWEEFGRKDYEGQISFFVQTLNGGEWREPEIAFAMLHTLYEQGIKRNERDRLEILLDQLRHRWPEAYAHHAPYYLRWRITHALAQDRREALPVLVTEMAATAGQDIDQFFNVLDQLAYYGHSSSLIEALGIAWPGVKKSTNMVSWGIDELAQRAGDYVIFDYLERHPSPDPKDPALIERLESYLPIDPERVAGYIAHLTGPGQRSWTRKDFELQHRPHPSDQGFDEWDEDEDDEWDEDEDDEWDGDEDKWDPGPDEGAQNLFHLTVEFLGYLRREEGVPYTKGELGREQIQRYLLERHAGELEPDQSLLETMRRPSPSPLRPHPRDPGLCPDRRTLDPFLAQLLDFINPQHYKAATTLELIPAWLRFLESRQLINSRHRAQTLQELRGLDQDLLRVWGPDPADPALRWAMEGWWEQAQRTASDD